MVQQDEHALATPSFLSYHCGDPFYAPNHIMRYMTPSLSPTKALRLLLDPHNSVSSVSCVALRSLHSWMLLIVHRCML